MLSCGVGYCRLSGIPLPLRLTRTPSHRHSRRGPLPHPLCLAPRCADPAQCPGVVGRLLSSGAPASGTSVQLYAAVGVVRVDVYGIRSADMYTGVTEVMAEFAPSGRTFWLLLPTVSIRA